MPTRSRQNTRSVVPRAKVWLERDGEYVFGAGISRILQAVEQAGSIKGAATIVGKSYRHVWSRIKEAESNLGSTLVETRVGGSGDHRSELTQEARDLIRRFDELRSRVLVQLESLYADGE